jgi:hypothetical protein
MLPASMRVHESHSMKPDAAMRRIDSLLAHVWMVRQFLKHSDDVVDDDQVQAVQRTLYDYQLAVGAAWKDQNAESYLKMARKKFAKLRQASAEFTRIQPEVSAHTNFQMAAASLATAVAEIGEILDKIAKAHPHTATGDFSEDLAP